MNALPTYYLPPNVEKPWHIPTGVSSVRIKPGTGGGPDGLEGMTFGGAWQPGQNGWMKTRAGWWVNMLGVRPVSLRRTFVHPGETIARGYPDGSADVWMVPQLLTIQPDGQPGYAIVERRDYEWRPPAYLENIMNRLRVAVVDGIESDDEVNLCADILALHYWLSVHELEVAGWLTPTMVADVLRAASGITAAERALAVANGR